MRRDNYASAAVKSAKWFSRVIRSHRGARRLPTIAPMNHGRSRVETQPREPLELAAAHVEKKGRQVRIPLKRGGRRFATICARRLVARCGGGFRHGGCVVWSLRPDRLVGFGPPLVHPRPAGLTRVHPPGQPGRAFPRARRALPGAGRPRRAPRRGHPDAAVSSSFSARSRLARAGSSHAGSTRRRKRSGRHAGGWQDNPHARAGSETGSSAGSGRRCEPHSNCAQQSENE
jgi:hypothetical protein